MVVASAGSGGTASGISAALIALSTSASDSPSTVPGPQVTVSARTASMHWPKVWPRTATPVEMTATSVIPGIALTAARFATDRTVPLIVGGRQTIVGSALGTARSIVNVLRPVTASSASIRFCGVPISANADVGFSCTDNGVVVAAAAATVSEP